MEFPVQDPRPLECPAVVNRDEVFVTWSTTWPMDRYIGWYLESRKHPVNDEWRDAVRETLKQYPGQGALRKSDVDFYLDTHAPTWAPVWVTRL